MKLRCGRVIDTFGWCYDFISREHKKFSRNMINVMRYDQYDYKKGHDVIYIHSPDISPVVKRIVKNAKEHGVKVIGGYAGNPIYWGANVERLYDNIDLIVTISPQTYEFACNNYKNTPVIFLPEPVDTEFFNTSKPLRTPKELVAGWAGGKHKKIKRVELLDKLDYPVVKQCDWAVANFVPDRTQENMVKFYEGIDILLISSLSECMPRVALEAMSMGRLLISTNVGGIPMLLSDRLNKGYMVSKDENEFVVRANWLLSHLHETSEEWIRHVSIQNRNVVQKYFSWRSCIDIWDDVFERVYNGQADTCVELARNFNDGYYYKFLPVVS